MDRAVFIASYCVSYDFILLFINNSNPNIYAGNTGNNYFVIIVHTNVSSHSIYSLKLIMVITSICNLSLALFSVVLLIIG